jgi:hypothetical protein
VPLVRTTCPGCDVVTVRAPELTVRHRAGSGAEAVFVCPACREQVVHPLSEPMVPVLIGAGCRVEDAVALARQLEHPSAGPAITEAEIVAFVAGLDRSDWFERLSA